jgi:addiction module RelB/DinJ family antitoxin
VIQHAGETTNINIRMDKALKEQAESLLSELGMNMTTAFNIFLRQAVRERAIPFQIALEKTSNEAERKRQARKEFGELVKSIQADSVRNGRDIMTMDDIDTIISNVRHEAGVS